MKPQALASLLLLAGLLLAAWIPAAPAATHLVRMGNYYFDPTNITVNAGDTVVWTNTTLTAHDTTSSTGLWASPTFARGNTWPFVFNNPGFYPYVCQVHVMAHPEQTGTVSVVSAAVPPTVTIASPTNGAVFIAPAGFSFDANATDSDGTITQVQFLTNGVALGTDTSFPYSVAVSGLAAGSYTLAAVATDNSALKATNSVSITVLTPPKPVTLLQPRWVGTEFRFSFSNEAGRLYQVQTATDPKPVTWSPVTNLTGTGSLLSVTNKSPTGTVRYYRVESK